VISPTEDLPMVERRLFFAVMLFAVSVGLTAGCGGEGGDQSDATVTITKPAPETIVSESNLTVRGTAQGTDQVEVNGESVEVVGGKWNVDLAFEQGPAVVEAGAGSARDRVEFTVDSHPPELRLESPERAIYVAESDGGTVTVRGTVEDGGVGLRLVNLNDEVLEVGDDGTFERTFELEEGLNVLEVEAVDEANNVATELRGVMHGEFVSSTDRIEPGVHVRIGPDALTTASTVVENYLTPERIEQYARQEVDSEQFDFRSVDFENLEVGIEPQSETLAASVAVENLTVEGDAQIGGEPFPVAVTLDEVTVETEVALSVDEDNELVVELEETELLLDSEDFHFSLIDDQGNRDEVDKQNLRNLAVRVIKRMFDDLLQESLVDNLYDPDILEREVEILERTFVFRVVPQSIQIRRERIHVQAAFEVSGEAHEQVEPVPGALRRSLGERQGEYVESDLKFRTNRRAAERLAHGVWRAGLLHQQLDAETFGDRELPVDLNAGALAFALDGRITNLASDETPAAVRLRPQLPPVVELSEGEGSLGESGEVGDRIGMRLGELMLDVLLLPEGEEPITVASVAIFWDLQVGVTLDGFALNFDFETDVRADLAAEPELDFEDAELEGLVSGLAETIPAVLSERMSVRGREEFDWIRFDSPRLEVRGENRDWVSLFTDIEPAGEQ
jgi:hypothetical protein